MSVPKKDARGMSNPKRQPRGVAAAVLMLLLATAVATGLAAQDRGPQDRKVALVIGNGAYRTDTVSPLINPPNDAWDVSRALQGIGFEVTTVTDGTKEAMGIAIEAFGAELQQADVGLFYYAGHGVQHEGNNYLIPVDADLPDTNLLRYRAIAADEVLAYMESAGSTLNMVFLDACRNNPLPQASRSMNRGLAAASMRPAETMIVYASAAGTVADDGWGRNSPFTQAFLRHIDTPGLDVYDLYREISSDVRRATDGEQRPEQYGNVTVRYSLVPDDGSGGARVPSLATVATYGSVRINAATTGTIYLDGDRLGTVSAGSSAVINDVETGSRSIEIRYDDGERETSSVTVREGATARASFSYVERPATSEYRVGDRGPAGGWVFYDKGSTSEGWRYLEAAPSDLDEMLRWSPAVSAADSYSVGGYNDWRLPTKDELDIMYENLHEEGVGRFASSFTYWSSTEHGSRNAFFLDFSNGPDGIAYYGSKIFRRRVRAIRAF